MTAVHLQDEHVVALKEARRLIWQLAKLGVDGTVSLCDDLDEIIGMARLQQEASLRADILGRTVFACVPDESAGLADDDPKSGVFRDNVTNLWDNREGK